MKKTLSVFAILVCFNSCVMLFNIPKTKIDITTQTPAKIIVNTDTFATKNNTLTIEVLRQHQPLKLIAINDSINKEIHVKSHITLAYFADFYYSITGFGIIGLIVDHKRPEKMTYPKTIYIPMNTAQPGYTKYLEEERKYKNILKISPLRLILSHPGLELSYERTFGKRFSTQFSAAALYKTDAFNSYSSGSGYQLNIEEKYYLRRSKASPYFSLDVGYFDLVNADYNEFWGFYNPDSTYDERPRGQRSFIYAAPKFGVQTEISKNGVFDVFVGLGPKYEKWRYISPLGPNGIRVENFWSLKFLLNFKLGICF